MATRSLLDRDGTTARQDAPTSLDTPATHDFPLPSRHLRLGLGSDTDTPDAAALSTVSTTEILLPADTIDDADTATDDAPEAAPAPQRPKPRHRLKAPPAALRARTALFAIAAGATAMAVTGSAGDGQPSPLAAAPAPAPVSGDDVAPAAHVTDNASSSRAVSSAPSADLTDFDSQLSVGQAYAKAKAAAEAAKRKPMFVSPLPLGSYNLTSAYAERWGSFHGGLDLAAPLGTPIHAVTDGVVIAAGPASGYGNWIQIKAADGSVTMYGHMSGDGVNVSKGEKVTAGDIIGMVGSEGFSTGPHVHFEVWLPKGGQLMKVDPAPWLAKKGVKLAPLTG